LSYGRKYRIYSKLTITRKRLETVLAI